MAKKPKKVGDTPIAKLLNELIESGSGPEENFKKLKDKGIRRETYRSWINGHRRPEQHSLDKVADAFDLHNYIFYNVEGIKKDKILTPDHKEMIDKLIKITDKKALKAIDINIDYWLKEGIEQK